MKIVSYVFFLFFMLYSFGLLFLKCIDFDLGFDCVWVFFIFYF